MPDTVVAETLWGGAHGWSEATDGYRIFRNDKQKRASDIMFYVK